jgi:hypothetical protein
MIATVGGVCLMKNALAEGESEADAPREKLPSWLNQRMLE